MPQPDPTQAQQTSGQPPKKLAPDAPTPKIKFKLTIAYDGTAYQGWQEQKTGTGIQQKIETALAKLFPSKPKLHSASRTDSGVHALGMVAHFEVPHQEFKKRRMPIRHLPLAINAWLPEDVRIVKAQRVSPEFHARFDAVSKQYRYFVWNHPVMNPLLRHTAWHVPRKLDIVAMRAAAKQFIGQHDFRAFAANPGYPKENTVRTVTRCEFKKSGPLLTFIIEADGFLYKMCRGIVGTIVQVGLGKFTPEQITQMLAQRDRRLAGMNAPAHGLVLWKVNYSQQK
ncbi:MAG: tRNA pseudouridine(38-40) synthase TruA [Verrucomicrobiae bacterium]|nr:tRNA pseudouridine(38-40) synthase TruA [Verrucomicrobiae bacterium]